MGIVVYYNAGFRIWRSEGEGKGREGQLVYGVQKRPELPVSHSAPDQGMEEGKEVAQQKKKECGCVRVIGMSVEVGNIDQS